MTNLISPIDIQQLTRRTLIGALVDDPVLRERSGRPRRRPRARTTRADRSSR